jgi:ferredoxin
VGINPERCNGAGICVQLAPEIFRFTEGSKQAKLIVEEIPGKHKESVREAVAQCPTKAIFVIGK